MTKKYDHHLCDGLFYLLGNSIYVYFSTRNRKKPRHQILG